MKKCLIVFLLPFVLMIQFSLYADEDKERDVVVLTGNRPVFGKILDRGVSTVTILLDNGETRTISRRNIIAITNETGYYKLYRSKPTVDQAVMLKVFMGPTFNDGYGNGYGIMSYYILREGVMLGLKAHVHSGENLPAEILFTPTSEKTKAETYAFMVGYVIEAGRVAVKPYFSLGMTTLHTSGFAGFTTPNKANRVSIPIGFMVDYNLYNNNLFLGIHAMRVFVPGAHAEITAPMQRRFMFTEGSRSHNSALFSVGYRFGL